MNFDEIKRRLTALDTACLCDANKELGWWTLPFTLSEPG